MSQKKEIVKDASIYSLMTYGGQVFDLLNALFIRRLLGPASMGVWTFLQVILSYAKHASLGTTMATARDVPYYLGKGDVQKANETKDLVFTFTVFTSVLLAAGVIVFAWMKRSNYETQIVIGLCVVAALVVLQRVYNLYVVLLRAYKLFTLTGILNLVSSVAALLLAIVFVWKFGLYGLYVSLVLNYFLLIGWIHLKTPARFHFYFSKEKMMPIWAFGGSMLITDILNTVFTSADRIMITKYLGFETLGVYSLALMAYNYLNSIPTMLAVVLFPHLQEAFSKNDDPRELDKLLHYSTFSIAYLFPTVIGLVWIISEYVLPLILPKYAAGMMSLKFLCLATFFYGLRFSFNAFIVTIKKHWLLVPMNLALVLSSFGLMWVMIRCGFGINGVAVAVLLVSVLNFVMFSWYSLNKIHSQEKIARFFARIFGVFLFFGLLLFGMDAVLHRIGGGWYLAVVAIVVYAIFMVPLYFLAERDLKIISLMKDMVVKKIARAKAPA